MTPPSPHGILATMPHHAATSERGPLRVVLADDHPVVRSGLRALLDSLGGYEVVAEAASGETAVSAVVEHRPDVVLLDIKMPDGDGIDATRRIRSAAPETAILILTMFDDRETVQAAMRAGALGYVLKGAEQTDIDRAIRAVAAGEAIFGAEVVQAVVDFSSAPSAPFPDLTTREREVLDLIAAGHRNQVIAGRLFLSPKTVANHVSSIFAKLGVTDRSEAIVRARREGFGEP